VSNVAEMVCKNSHLSDGRHLPIKGECLISGAV